MALSAFSMQAVRNAGMLLLSARKRATFSQVNESLIVFVAIADATSPALVPPIPSATTTTAPFSLRGMYEVAS